MAEHDEYYYFIIIIIIVRMMTSYISRSVVSPEEEMHSKINMMPISCLCHHHLHPRQFDSPRYIGTIFLNFLSL